jgi:CheY-like chemotaxis protein/HPt (histidine-containing phosphotransfer) domain-containing protein
LVIDDQPLERMLLAESLEGLGLDVLVVEDAEHCVAAIEEAERLQRPFDLVFVDCRMPGTNGFELVKRMSGSEGGYLRVVMLLTTDHRRGDIERCEQQGFAGYLFKPVKLSALAELVVATGEGMPSSDPEGEAAVARSHLPGLRILLAEDSCDNQLLIRAYLKGTTHTLVMANDGIEAIQRFREDRFDLVLMDMQMPVKDGYCATREIRSIERDDGRPRTRIVSLTAHAFDDEAKHSLDAGCDEHETKPISKRRLLEIIDRTRSGVQVTPHDDRRQLVNPDPEVADLVAGYLDNRREEIAVLSEALAGSQFDRIRVLGHNMKGNGGGYGCLAISEIGARMEAAAKVSDAAGVEEAIAELMDFLSAVRVDASHPVGDEEGAH